MPLSVASKVLCKFILDRMKAPIEDRLQDEQVGFCKEILLQPD